MHQRHAPRGRLGSDGKLHEAAELAIELLSPGEKNERRGGEAKRKLYPRRGGQECDWRRRRGEIYRRGDWLEMAAELLEGHTVY